MTKLLRARASYTGLAVATIVIGLWIHRGGLSFGPALRDIAGDALWAMMIAWWVGAAFPSARVLPRSTAAIAICFCVELSQLAHTPTLDAIRRTTAGRLVLGSGFDPRDFAAYALGVLTAAVLEWWWVRRRQPL